MSQLCLEESMNFHSVTAILLPCLLVAACHARFTPTEAGYAPAAREPSTVRVTRVAPGPGYAEVGRLSAGGSSFNGAVKRIRDQAADEGCDVVAIWTSGDSFATNKGHVRASCFVTEKEPAEDARATAKSAPPCEPECRRGFDCRKGRCVSACNPPCDDGQACLGHGAEASCVPTAGDAGAR